MSNNYNSFSSLSSRSQTRSDSKDTDLRQYYEKRNSELIAKNRDLTSQQLVFKKESEKLKREIVSLKEYITKLDSERKYHLKHVTEIENLRGEIVSLKEYITKLDSERNYLLKHVTERDNVMEEVLENNKGLKQQCSELLSDNKSKKYSLDKLLEEYKKLEIKFQDNLKNYNFAKGKMTNINDLERRIEELQTENNHLRENSENKIQSAEENYTELAVKYKERTEKYGKIYNLAKEQKDSLKSVQKDLESIVNEQSEMKANIVQYKSTIEDLHKKLEESDYQLKCLQEKNNELKEQSQSHFNENSELITIIELSKKRINDLEKEISNLQDLENNYGRRNETVECQLNNEAELSHEYNKMFQSLQKTEAKVFDLQREFTEKEQSVKNLQFECDNYKKILHVKNDSLTNNIKEKQELKEVVRKYESNIKGLEQDLLLLQEEVKMLKIENERLKEINEDSRRGNITEEKCKESEFSLQREESNKYLSILNHNPESSSIHDEMMTLRKESEKMTQLLKDKDWELKDCKEEIITLKSSLKIYGKENSKLDLQTDDSKMFSSIPNSYYESPKDSIILLRRENEELKKALEEKEKEIRIKKTAIDVMKEKLRSQKSEVDVNTLKLQNRSYLTQLKESEVEREKLKESYKTLRDQAEMLKKDKLNIEAEMNNLKKLNLNTDNAPSSSMWNSTKVPSSTESTLIEKCPAWWRLHMSNVN